MFTTFVVLLSVSLLTTVLLLVGVSRTRQALAASIDDVMQIMSSNHSLLLAQLTTLRKEGAPSKDVVELIGTALRESREDSAYMRNVVDGLTSLHSRLITSEQDFSNRSKRALDRETTFETKIAAIQELWPLTLEHLSEPKHMFHDRLLSLSFENDSPTDRKLRFKDSSGNYLFGISVKMLRGSAKHLNPYLKKLQPQWNSERGTIPDVTLDQLTPLLIHSILPVLYASVAVLDEYEQTQLKELEPSATPTSLNPRISND